MCVHELVPTPAEHPARRLDPFARVFGNDFVGPVAAAAQEPRQAVAVHRIHRVRRAPVCRRVEHGRQQIDEGYQLADAAGRVGPRLADDQRHADGPLEERLLVPHAALAEHFAVVADEDDDRVVGKTGRLHGVHDPADFVVDVGDHAVVGVTGRPHLLVGDGMQMATVPVVEPATVLVQLLDGNGRNRGHVDVVVVVLIPIPGRGDERRVRVCEGNHQEERIVPGITRKVVDLLKAEVLDFVVVVDLQAADALSGLHDGQEADARRPVLGLVGPVGSPHEIRRIDVRSQPFPEAMELVRTDEMHLAAENGAVTEIV